MGQMATDQVVLMVALRAERAPQTLQHWQMAGQAPWNLQLAKHEAGQAPQAPQLT